MKIIRFFFLGILCTFFWDSFSFCQKLDTGLNVQPIKSISWTKFEYSDLHFFEKILKQKNILTLSESDHGDGSSYEAQCMIMKGLIDSSKINTIYTESSWIVIDKINDILKIEGKQGIQKTIGYMQSVELRYWAGTGFWNYLANKIIEGKVVLKGFDVGASQTIITELFNECMNLKQVKAYIQSNEKTFEEVKFDYDNFDGWHLNSTFYKDGYDEQKVFIDSVIEGYRLTNNLYRIKQWQSVLDFFYWMYKRTIVLKGNKYLNVPEGDIQQSALMSIRDSLMASYFLREYNLAKNIKVVALMSSYHAMHNSNLIEDMNDCCKTKSNYIMGEILDKEIGEQLYNMCFITSSGERGINYDFTKKQLRKIPKPKLNSLEYSLKVTSTPYGVIDFKNSSLKDSLFYMGPVFYRYLRSKWFNNFSGVFFIKKMESLIFKNLQDIKE